MRSMEGTKSAAFGVSLTVLLGPTFLTPRLFQYCSVVIERTFKPSFTLYFLMNEKDPNILWRTPFWAEVLGNDLREGFVETIEIGF